MDDLDRSIEQRVAADPEYANLLDAEVRRQRLIAHLVEIRKANGLTQAAVARTMNVGQSVVAEIESAKADIRFSTLDRYAAAVTRRQLSLQLARVWVRSGSQWVELSTKPRRLRGIQASSPGISCGHSAS